MARAFSSRVRHPVRDHVESDSLSNRPNILDYTESDKLFETLRIQTTLSETTVRRITHIVYVESVKHIVRDYAESNTLSKISQSQTHCLRLQRVRHVVWNYIRRVWHTLSEITASQTLCLKLLYISRVWHTLSEITESQTCIVWD